MNDEELTKTIYEKIGDALDIQRYEQTCLVRNFRLVKVIVPTNVMKELIMQCNKVKKINLENIEGIATTIMSVPIEEDETATRIRYVIEGDLKFYE